MKVAFVTKTPLAGAPYRIAQALNRYTEFQTRVIDCNPDFYGVRTYPEDLVWSRHREECLDALASADIVQTFHWIDYHDDRNFLGLALDRVVKSGARFVRMYSSDIDFVARNTSNCTAKDLLGDVTPRMVIPHYPERTFPDAFVVPNIIPIDDPLLMPAEGNAADDSVRVFFSASSKRTMWAERWNTKGVPEVLRMLKRARRKVDFSLDCVTDTTYAECMTRKQQSDIVIGDTTSGSYHLTDLEALSQGKPTFTYLDGRSECVLMALLGCRELPFVNSRLEEFELPLVELVRDHTLRREIGAFSRDWIEKYYSDAKLVEFYCTAYERLLNGGDLHRQDHLRFARAKTFLFNRLYDLQWKSRQRNPLIAPSVARRFRKWLKSR